MLNFSILFLSTVTAGTPDSDSQLYRRIPEDSFSSSGSNDRMLTNFVGKRGDLVSDIRIGKRSRQDADCYKGGMGFDHDYYRTTVGTLDRWSRTSVEMGCSVLQVLQEVSAEGEGEGLAGHHPHRTLQELSLLPRQLQRDLPGRNILSSSQYWGGGW